MEHNAELQELQDVVSKYYHEPDLKNPYVKIEKMKILSFCVYLVKLNTKENSTYVIIYSYINGCYDLHEVAEHDDLFYDEGN